jgi:serine/threonine protein phosphatase PrpC
MLWIEPEVREHMIDPFKDEFIVMGSDGLFEEMTSQEVADFIRSRLINMPEYDNDPRNISYELVREVSVN